MSPRFGAMLAAALAAAFSFGGCGAASDARDTIAITFRFADGRRCAEAGALQVRVESSDGAMLECSAANCLYLCSDGETQGVSLDVPAAGTELRLTALSPQGDPLYRALLEVPANPPPALAATFYYTAGQ